MDKEKVIDKLRKLKALADRGVDGEAVKAGELYNQLSSRYGITLEMIQKEENLFQEFIHTVKPAVVPLFIQIVAMVTDRTSTVERVRDRTSLEVKYHDDKFSVYTTMTEHIEISAMMEHYSTDLQQQLNRVTTKAKQKIDELDKKRRQIVNKANKDCEETVAVYIMANQLYPDNAEQIDLDELSGAEYKRLVRLSNKASKSKTNPYLKQLNA